MALGLNTNISSTLARRHVDATRGDLASAVERLSSGLRIASARDDAAGLAIADRLTSQVRGIKQAARNANDAISLTQTAEGALATIAGNLQRVRELSVQAANASNSTTDRAALQSEVVQLVAEIDRVATQTSFNGTRILDGSFTGQQFQTGANARQTITLDALADMRSGALGTSRGLSVRNQTIGAPSNTPQWLIGFAAGVTSWLTPVAVDAKAVAAGFNAGNIPGLKLTANATSVAAGTSQANAASAGSALFTINGVAIDLAGATGAHALASNRASAVNAINAQSAATGVVASDTGSGVALVAADGRNVLTTYTAGSFAGSSAADFGLAAPGLSGSTVNIDYVAPAGATGSILVAQATGGLNAVLSIGTIGTPVSALDISSAAGATSALATLDRALESVNSTRARLGAAQNRFASTIDSLATNGANVEASRSRIQDADFAQETANLSRAQVLQQAGTAMIAQANQLPQQVLQLIR